MAGDNRASYHGSVSQDFSIGAFGHFQRDLSPTTLWLTRMQSTNNMNALDTASVDTTYLMSERREHDVVTPPSAMINWGSGGTENLTLQDYLAYSGDIGTGIEP
jgi:hypothetical protein